MYRARCALPHLPITVCPRLGSGKLGVRLAAHSQLILLRVRLVLRLAAGWRQPPAAESSPQLLYNKKRTVFNKRVRPHSACATLKTALDGANAEPLANKAWVSAKRQILGAGKICLFFDNSPKNLNASKEQAKIDTDIYMLLISSNNVNILLLFLSSRLIGSICYNSFGWLKWPK